MSTPIVDAENFVPKLLDTLKKAKAKAVYYPIDAEEVVNKFKQIEDELQSIEDLPPTVKHWEQGLFSQFTALERHLYKMILGSDGNNVKGMLDRMYGDVKKIKHLIPPDLVNLMPAYERVSQSSTHVSRPELGLCQNMSQEWLRMDFKNTILENEPAMTYMRSSYEHLESSQMKLCLLSFSIFPEAAVIKKRPLIYWWIGKRFIKSTRDRTAEELGEDICEKLMNRDLIQPHDLNACTSTTAVTMHPWIRRMLISLMFTSKRSFHAEEGDRNYLESFIVGAVLVSDKESIPWTHHLIVSNDVSTVFNVNDQYPNLKREWLTKAKKLEVLQLGRWQQSPTHHIELDDEEFLKGLGSQKLMKYLSLRGISAIIQIPPSILDLTSLEILDLRACHNLEILPSDISPLRKLTHLDISECYLLDRMPKGIDQLSSLQVLKGYVIGDLEGTPCRIGDFVKLKNLKRLSIHVGNEAVVQDGEFKKLKNILSLRRLKISWRVTREKFKADVDARSLEFSFPPGLEKLDLEAIPLSKVPQWLNPRQLPDLKKLYIRGGKLDSLDHGEIECRWKVEILRLKYLNNLKIGFPKLEQEFPHLQYLEKMCRRIKKEKYNGNIVWSKAEGDITAKYFS